MGYPVIFVLALFIALASCKSVDHKNAADGKAAREKMVLGFASYYGDHMVLQKAPATANVWGYADAADVGMTVTVQLSSSAGSTTFQSAVRALGPIEGGNTWYVWLVTFAPVAASMTPYTITATLGAQVLTINDVLFGDVWVCSGQSNMQMTVVQMQNATDELDTVDGNYPGLRLFTATLVESPAFPLYDLNGIQQPWSLSSRGSVGANAWGYHSAICWVFGRTIYRSLNHPIGLVVSAWGGTRIEAWMSPQALGACGLKGGQSEEGYHYVPNSIFTGGVEHQDPNDYSALWNAMIHPFLNMSIYGATWYQGESNTGPPSRDYYTCMFREMINDWRMKFAANSGTSNQFPFGFIQLGANSRAGIDFVQGFTDIRWHLTHDWGFVPNNDLQNVFMGTALDTPDFDADTIHPRDKITPGERMARAGLAVAYGQSGLYYNGPWPTSFTKSTATNQVTVVFDNGMTPIVVRSNGGFEVCCASDTVFRCAMSGTGNWVAAPIVGSTGTSVSLGLQNCALPNINGVRHIWRESPCEYLMCPVYSVQNSIVAPPFVYEGNIPDGVETKW